MTHCGLLLRDPESLKLLCRCSFSDLTRVEQHFPFCQFGEAEEYVYNSSLMLMGFEVKLLALKQLMIWYPPEGVGSSQSFMVVHHLTINFGLLLLFNKSCGRGWKWQWQCFEKKGDDAGFFRRSKSYTSNKSASDRNYPCALNLFSRAEAKRSRRFVRSFVRSSSWLNWRKYLFQVICNSFVVVY